MKKLTALTRPYAIVKLITVTQGIGTFFDSCDIAPTQGF